MFYWKYLVFDLKRCREKRFINHFNVTEVGEFAAITALTHPRFKSSWTHCLDIIAEEKIKEIMEKSVNLGMKTFDQCLFELFCEGAIDEEEALRNADSVNNLKLKIRGC